MSRINQFRSKWLLPPIETPPSVADIPAWEGVREAVHDLLFPVDPDSSPDDIIGQCSAYIIVSFLDVAVAQACLLPNVELTPPPGTPAGKHPVLYCFGQQIGVGPRYSVAPGDNYNETTIGLPFVGLRHSDGTLSGPYFQMTALRLNDLLAVEIGIAIGFPKELAIMDVTNTTYSIQMNPFAGDVMYGTFGITGAQFGPDFPNFQTIKQMLLQQPVISQTAEGVYLVTSFRFDTRNATMFPADADFTVADSSIAGLPEGDYTFPGIDVTAFGGCFHSVHNWTLSPPSPIAV